MAKIRTSRLNDDGTFLHVYMPTEAVVLWKHPAAVALGALKRGVKERKSTLKAATARANGSKPAGIGKVRGRPGKYGARKLRSLPYEPVWKTSARVRALGETLKELGCVDDVDDDK